MAANIDTFNFAPLELRSSVNLKYLPKNPDSTPFLNWMAQVKNDGPGRIEKEFELLTDDLRNFKPNTIEAWKQNAQSNRYNDMVCFDQSRVTLDDGLSPDYVNANWVAGFHRKNAYILTQGPTEETVVDFWRMIWQENIATVVMVTRLEEKGRVKCARYFPTVDNVPYRAGIFKIELKKKEKRNLCFALLFSVTNLLLDEIHYVVLVWYICWPDQGVPEDMDSLRHFLNYVKLININMSNSFYDFPGQHIRGPPIVFHCSAGVGRSAALVAIDIVNESMLHGHHVDVLDLVKRMRKERFHAIHTKIQLLFVYDFFVSLAVHNRHKLASLTDS